MEFVLIVGAGRASACELAERVAAKAPAPDLDSADWSALRSAVEGTALRWRRVSRHEPFAVIAILKWASAFAGQRYDGEGSGAPILEGKGSPDEVLRAIEPLSRLEGSAVLCCQGAADAVRGRPDVLELSLSPARGQHVPGAALAISAAPDALEAVPAAAAAAIGLIRRGVDSARG